ncbi:putative OTU-like cysteine protease [Chloropicon primus]|uniref:Putative OTU-like cysteine protease n=2 Tax=Chloropicon primus TaxID=1764295 RepID=A0A5B8MJ18_9CHLO|nr:putative OTU-like cysteine protease [Chloropicon primus]UPQ99706.1 putative OTU-like cysteine protease [Chloropicon primus]|eukprot:QDZ20496.1 putative OTU-like cysteine protease [Chloropicon primus]
MLCLGCFVGKVRRGEEGGGSVDGGASGSGHHRKTASMIENLQENFESFIGSSLRKRVALKEEPSIRSNLTPTPRRVTQSYLRELEAAESDSSEPEGIEKTSVDILRGAKTPRSPLPLHTPTEELFINFDFLSSKNVTELESVRQALSGGKPEEPATSRKSWTPNRKKLQNGIDKELKRCNTPVGARGYLENAKARLSRRLERLNLQLRSTQGDGNCQFRAISFQLFGTEDLYEMVRERSVSYLEEQEEGYQDFFGGRKDFKRYIYNMRLDKTWGDEMTLCGAANAFECVINVITSESSNWFLQYWPKDMDASTNAEGTKEIFVGYTFPLHYDGISGQGIKDSLSP